MSLLGATILTAVATLALAIFAFITAIFAVLAFLKQSREVRAIERQVIDEQEVTSQQAELLKVQTGQLEVLRAQLEDQRKASVTQAEVLQLQAAELRESLTERKREAEQRHRAQAAAVFIAQEFRPKNNIIPGTNFISTEPLVAAYVRNTSNQPIYDVSLYWYHTSTGHRSTGHGNPNPEPLGTLLPDTEVIRVRNFPSGANTDTSGVNLHFTDGAGIEWVRATDGALKRVQQPSKS